MQRQQPGRGAPKVAFHAASVGASRVKSRRLPLPNGEKKLRLVVCCSATSVRSCGERLARDHNVGQGGGGGGARGLRPGFLPRSLRSSPPLLLWLLLVCRRRRAASARLVGDPCTARCGQSTVSHSSAPRDGERRQTRRRHRLRAVRSPWRASCRLPSSPQRTWDPAAARRVRQQAAAASSSSARSTWGALRRATPAMQSGGLRIAWSLGRQGAIGAQGAGCGKGSDQALLQG